MAVRDRQIPVLGQRREQFNARLTAEGLLFLSRSVETLPVDSPVPERPAHATKGISNETAEGQR
jgi:hypothetical protein